MVVKLYELYELYEWGGLHGLFALQIASYPSAHFLKLHIRLYYHETHVHTYSHTIQH